MTKKMTRDEEHESFADPENHAPQGPARRRRAPLTEMVPVRFPEATLEEIRRRAEADDRTVSAWIRRSVEHELQHPARSEGPQGSHRSWSSSLVRSGAMAGRAAESGGPTG